MRLVGLIGMVIDDWDRGWPSPSPISLLDGLVLVCHRLVWGSIVCSATNKGYYIGGYNG